MVDVMLPSQVLLFLFCFIKLWRLSNWSWHHICSCLILVSFRQTWNITMGLNTKKTWWCFSQVGDFSVRIPHGYYSQRTQTCVLIWKYMGIFHGIHAVGPVFHRHPTSPLLVTHVDSIEWTLIKCIYIYTYIDKTPQTFQTHIFFWKWIPFEQKEMFNIIPLPWCFFLSGVGRAPHPPCPETGPGGTCRCHGGQDPSFPKAGVWNYQVPFFWGNFGGVQWSWKKKDISHPPKGATQQLFQKFLVWFCWIETPLTCWREMPVYTLKNRVFSFKRDCVYFFYRFNWAMNKSVVVWCI